MKIVSKLTVLFLLIITQSCDKPLIGYKYNKGSLPEKPVNLSDFNTSYDDYNSTAPSLGYLIPFCFSTNRNSRGGEFDVLFQPMNVNFDKNTGELTVTNEYANWSSKRSDYDVIQKAIQKIRSGGNEYGPNLIVKEQIIASDTLGLTLMYSTDVTGNAQINYVDKYDNDEFSEPQEVQFLNSDFDDMYPGFNDDYTRLYFCSNRKDEQFDIYYVNVNPENGFKNILSDTTDHDVIRDAVFSSNANDKCPFIFEDMMVFASDRPGGYGGFDLYFSKFINGEWSDPVNFGADVNSDGDDYRPILIEEGVTEEQTMMVFSSNREGGFGGFDLYFLGINR